MTTSIDFTCADIANNYTLSASYPFKNFQQKLINSNGKQPTGTVTLGDDGIPRSAEYFVAWGVLTLFYSIIAILVYMLVTANERWERAFDFLVVVVSTAFLF